MVWVSLLVEQAPDGLGVDGGHLVDHVAVLQEVRGDGVAGIERGVHGEALAEDHGRLVEEADAHAGRAERVDLVAMPVFELGLIGLEVVHDAVGMKLALGDADDAVAVAGVEGGEGEEFGILVHLEARVLERCLKPLEFGREDAVLEGPWQRRSSAWRGSPRRSPAGHPWGWRLWRRLPSWAAKAALAERARAERARVFAGQIQLRLRSATHSIVKRFDANGKSLLWCWTAISGFGYLAPRFSCKVFERLTLGLGLRIGVPQMDYLGEARIGSIHPPPTVFQVKSSDERS